MGLKYISSLILVLTLAACHSGGNGFDDSEDPGPYQLTFSLDASFNIPHGNQLIHIALVRLTDGMPLESASGTVSATENPAFVFMPLTLLENGTGYAVRYWIDSNIGGGTLGVCDSTTYDHQWSTEFYLPTNDISFTASHQPALTEYVCATFP